MTILVEELLGTTSEDPLRAATLAALGTTDRGTRLGRIARLIPTARHDEWLSFAHRNEVAPVVAHALLELCGRSVAGGRARAIHDAASERMSVMLAALDEVASRFAREGIRLIALKNAGIARGVFPCPGCCPMGDVDTLVDRACFRDAHALIEESGFELVSRAPDVEPADLEHGLSSGGTEYRKRIGGHEVWFELQWRAIAGRWIRKDQEPDTGTLLERSVEIPGTAIRLLSPADNMLQVCLHTAKHTYVRAPGLRLHTDVDRLAAYAPPNWPALIDLARHQRVMTPVYFSLAISHALLNADVPVSVLDTLAPAAWKRAVVVRWLRQLDVFEPAERKFRRPDMMLFHALLYDDAAGLFASVLDTSPDLLRRPSMYPKLVRQGWKRVYDLATRYQR